MSEPPLVESPIRRHRLLGLFTAVLAVLAAPVGAQAASIVLTTPSTGGPGHPVTVREKGVSDHGENFVYVFLSPMTTPCAATLELERATPQTRLVDNITLPKGPYNHLSSGLAISPAPGLYRLCGYLNSLKGSVSDPLAGPPDADATLVLGKQSTSVPFHTAPPPTPHGPLVLTLTPSVVADGYAVTVAASGTYSQWSQLNVEVQESAAPCASTFSAENTRIDNQTDPYDASLIGYELGNPDVTQNSPVPYTQSANFLPDGAGPYRFCAYLLVPRANNPGAGPSDPPRATAEALLRISPNAVPGAAPLPG